MITALDVEERQNPQSPTVIGTFVDEVANHCLANYRTNGSPTIMWSYIIPDHFAEAMIPAIIKNIERRFFSVEQVKNNPRKLLIRKDIPVR